MKIEWIIPDDGSEVEQEDKDQIAKWIVAHFEVLLIAQKYMRNVVEKISFYSLIMSDDEGRAWKKAETQDGNYFKDFKKSPTMSYDMNMHSDHHEYDSWFVCSIAAAKISIICFSSMDNDGAATATVANVTL